MKLHVRSCHVFLFVALLLGPFVVQAATLHPCGLIRKDPRTVSWMIQDKPVPGAPPRTLGSVDLSSQLPPVGDQGSQGSCTAWAIAYYQKTHYEYLEHHWNDSTTNHEFSPAFVYNQINGGADYGSDFPEAYSLIADQGCASMADCAYNDNDCTTWPSESAYARAIPNRGSNTHWFEMSDTEGIDMARQRLDSGYTTVIAIPVYPNFDNIDSLDTTYCVADTYGSSRGDHAVTIVGYDDNKSTHDGKGAFKMVNSWGTGWGNSGYWWMSYVAAMSTKLSYQEGYYEEDHIGYSPTLIGRVKITHPARDKVGIQLGVGSTSSPRWAKNFRLWRHPNVDQPFPNHNIVFDMTEGAQYLSNGQTDSVFVRVIDDSSDGKTGTIHYFAGQQLVWNSTGVSSDTPVSIPDYNVGVYARARMTRPHDVGVAAILTPTGTVDSGASVSPQAKVRNYGTSAASFPVRFRIGTYADSQQVTNLAAGDSTTLTFASWTAKVRGANAARCSTGLSGDENSGNDTLRSTVSVRVRDVACTQLLAPADTVDSGTTVTPKAVIKNLGTTSETLNTRFAIGSGYADTVSVTVAAGKTDTVSFASWTALQLGTFPVTCSTMLATDMNPANNMAQGSVVVIASAGIVEQTGLPRALSLERPLPDPMRGQATIRFSIPHVTQAGVSIRSATGALVRTLSAPQSLAPGTYSLTWDGRDDSGRRVARGVYFWRLESGSTTLTRKSIKIE